MSINEYAFSFLKEAREASLVRELEIRRRQIEHLKEEGVLPESIPTGVRRLITVWFRGPRSSASGRRAELRSRGSQLSEPGYEN